MKILLSERSKTAYLADYILYGITIAGLLLFLLLASPQNQTLKMIWLVVLGALFWTLVEYVIHRVILHGVQPFQRWHEEHHRRPTARMRIPTLFSAALFLTLFFLPVLFFGGDLWLACSLTLGLLSGYLIYTITHHAIHHWRSDNAWLKRRQHWHGLHHDLNEPRRYGTTSKFWDRVFGSG